LGGAAFAAEAGFGLDVRVGDAGHLQVFFEPVMGRFISEDPKGFGAGVNFYAYCLDNPVNCNDPSGNVPNSYESWKEAAISGFGVISNVSTAFGGGSLVIGGSAVAAVPGAELPGIATIVLGSTLIGKGLGGIALSSSNFMDAWNNQPPSLPISLPRLIAEGYAPGNLNALAAADLFDIGTDVAALKVPVGGYYDTAGTYITQNSMQISNWETASNRIANLPGVSVGLAGNSNGTLANVFGAASGAAAYGYGWYKGTACTTCDDSEAEGGFLLYPNKSNTNQMQSVYRK